ncbi:hypothetical protein [Terrimonas sp.]
MHYNIYVTNVGSDILPPSEVRKTYYLRWQIELVFKRGNHSFALMKLNG